MVVLQIRGARSVVGRAPLMIEAQRLRYKKGCSARFFIECCATSNEM